MSETNRLTPSRCVGAALLVVAAFIAAGCGKDAAARKAEYLESGNRFFEQGQYPSAILEYRNAIALDATFGEAHKRLAGAYQRAGDPRRALDEYVRAADLLAADFDVQLTAGKYLLAAGRSDDALARADAALALKPGDVQAHLLRGHALAGLRSYDEALASIEEAIRLDPKRGDTYANLGAMALASGAKDDAEAAFKQAVALAPRSTETHLALGYYYWAVGQAAEAERAFHAVLEIEPANDAANRLLAALTMSTGRRADAEQYLRRLAQVADKPEGTIALADYYLQSGRPKDAIARLEPLASKDRNLPAARELLARAYAVTGDLAKAKTLSEELLSANPRHVLALLLKARLLEGEGRRDEALQAVRAAIVADPASAEAQFALGRMLVARGETAAAEGAFREVLRLNPVASAAQVELAGLQIAAGKVSESLGLAEQATRSQPDNLAARLALVRALLTGNDLARAEKELAPLRAAYGHLAVIHNMDGMLAMLRNDVQASYRAYERALAIEPDSLDALTGHVALDVKSGNTAGARARLEKRLQQGNATQGLLLLAARTYLVAQDQAAAERVLRRAIEADPSDRTAYAMLGQIYVSQRKLDQARIEFETLATRQSKPVAPLTMSAMILESQGRIDLARKRYEDVLALDSGAVIAANNLAWIYADAGEKLDTALALAQTATAAAPESPELMDTLGWVYYKKQLPQLAIPLFQRSIGKAPGDASYHYHLGLAYVQAGDAANARKALERALASNPDVKTAQDIRRILADNTSVAPVRN